MPSCPVGEAYSLLTIIAVAISFAIGWHMASRKDPE